MSDQRKTKAQLIAEVGALRAQVAELERRASSTEVHYRALVDSLDVSLCRWLPDTTLTFANDRYRRIFGIQGEAVGQQWRDFLPVETRAATAAFYAGVAAQPRTVTYEHPVTIDDGEVRQYQWIDTPILDAQGHVQEFQSLGLDITDRKQAEAVLSESEARFRGLLDATPDAMVIIDEAGLILMTNAQTERIFGYTQAELIGSAVEKLLPESLHAQHLRNRAEFMLRPRMVTTGLERDIYASRKTGEKFPAEISLSHHVLANGEAVVLCAVRDVTERKRTQQVIAVQRDLARLTNAELPAEELWKICFQAAMQVSGLDSGGIYLFNEQTRQLELGYHAGLGLEFVAAVRRFAEDTPSAQLVLAGQTSYLDTAQLNARDYHRLEGLHALAVIPIQHHEQVLGCINIASHTLDHVPDFARNALEALAPEIGNVIIHQHTEEALRVSRDQLSQTLVAARMGTWRYDLTTNRMSWSPEASRLFGADMVQSDFETVLAHFHPDDRAKLLTGLRETLTQKKVLSLEYRLLAASGEVMWVTNYGHIECDAAGRPLAISGLIQDITERKLSETALATSEKKLKSLVESQSHFMIRTNMEGKYSYWNAQFEKEFGWLYEPQGIQNADVLTAVCEDHHPRVKEIVAECIASPGRVFTVEIDKPGRNGVRRTTLWEFICLTDEHNQPAEIQCMGIEISDRKQAEQALRESEARAQAMLKAIPDMMFRISRQGVFLDYRAEARDLYVRPDELIAKPIAASLPPYLVEQIEANLALTLDTRQLHAFEYQLDMPGQGRREFEARMTPGGTDEVIAIVRDITERKQADEKLRESEAKYRSLIDSQDSAISTIDVAGVFHYINSNGASPFGTPDHVVGKKLHDLFPPAIADWQLNQVRQVIATGQGVVHEYKSEVAGKPSWRRVSLQPIHRADGRIKLATVNSLDITERKQAEEDLRLAEQRYRAMIENAPDGIVLIDVSGKFKYASPSVERIFGYGQPDLPHCDSMTMTHPDDLPAVLGELTKLLADPAYIPSLQYRFRHKNGEWRWIESTFSNLLTMPNVAAIIINFRDIHARKLAEDDLKKSQDLLKEAQRIGRIGYMEWNGRGQQLVCSDEIYEIYGLPHGTLISQYVIGDLMTPEESERIRLLDEQAIQQRRDMNYEYGIRTTDGRQRWLHQIGKMSYAEDGQPNRMMMIVQDITERKQAEAALRASEEKYRGLMESLNSVVATIDANGIFQYMNDMGAERLGGAAADLIGKHMTEVFPEPLAAKQLAGVRQIFEADQEASFEAQSMGADHVLRWYRFSLQPLHDDRGQVVQVLINATDIHDLKTAQQELQQLNRTLEERVMERTAQVQDLYDNAPTGYHSLDADGCFVEINQTELNWLGCSREQVLGQPFARFVTEADTSQFQWTFPALKRTGKAVNLEFDMKRSDGTSFPVLINAVAILDEHGNYVRSRSTMTDITERKRAENELKRNVNFTNALLEAIPTPVFYKDKAGRYQGCNRAFSDVMGRTPEQIRGKTVYELWPSVSAATYHQRDLELMQNCVQQVYESTIIDKHGTVRPVIFVKDIFTDESGHVAGLVGAFVDITERKQAEEALRERERQAQSLLRLSRNLEQAQTYPDVLNAARAEVQTTIGYQNLWTYLLSEDMKYAHLLMAGGPIEEKLQAANTLAVQGDPLLEEIVGAKEIVVIADARTDARTNKAIVELLGNRTIINVPIVLFDRNLGSVGVGTFGDEGVRVPTVSDREYLTALASHMAVTFDRIHLLTERQRTQEELQLANGELQRALRVKDEFLASMSHELRTPLNAILGLSESLIEQFIGALNERQLRAMQTIEASGRHLLDLINDILDLSKLEANQVTLELAPVNVDDVCEASLLFVRDKAYKKYIQMTRTLDPDVKHLQVDERRLKQMLVNLLSNAVKFTPEGGAVKLQVVGNAADRTVSFSVSDTGIGIAPENIGRLFQPFVQLDGGLSRQYEGTGLGLSLVARMAKLHGGSVAVDSEPGRGSRFTIVLPWVKPDFPATATINTSAELALEDAAQLFPVGDHAPLILLAEDNESNIITLSTYLQATGYRVAIARNGQEALDQAHFKRPAIILMDLQMPVMDGLEATRRLRQDSDPQLASLPVIALTALAMPADRNRSLAAGATEYLSKPVNLKHLTELINRLVGEK